MTARADPIVADKIKPGELIMINIGGQRAVGLVIWNIGASVGVSGVQIIWRRDWRQLGVVIEGNGQLRRLLYRCSHELSVLRVQMNQKAE